MNDLKKEYGFIVSKYVQWNIFKKHQVSSWINDSGAPSWG